MPGTPGTRTGLTTVLPGDGVTAYRTVINAIRGWVEANATPSSAGVLSSRPPSSPGSPGVTGRLYHATDVGLTFRDTGTGWVVVGGRELVTALPGSPYNGQEILFLADAANGVIWPLRYRSAAPGAYKWESTGSPAAIGLYLASGITTSSVAYVSLGSDDLAVALPLAGDYDVTLGYETSGNFARMAPVATGLAATDDNSAHQGGAGSTERTLRALAISGTLTVRYRSSLGNSTDMLRRSLWAKPVRVG